MNRTFRQLASVFALLLFTLAAACADDLAALSGKWIATRSDDQGRSGKMILEIKQSKFTFQVQSGGQTVLYAEGDVKAESAGPLKTAKFFNIQGGQSKDELQAVDDERTVVYLLSGDELTVAANFDKERSEPPSVTKYTKATEESKTLVIDKIVMKQTVQSVEFYLCFEATVEGVTKRFNLPNKTYEGKDVTVTTELAVPNVKPGQNCKFVLKLDDVAGDECTEEMDNRSAGSFSVSESGSQAYKPEDQWNYTIHWHLK